MSCNLTSSSSIDELYQASLSEEDFRSLLRSHALGDVMVDFCLQTCTSQVNIFAPLTRNQAMKSPQAAEWLAAEQKEIESIKNNRVFRAAQLSKGKKLLKTVESTSGSASYHSVSYPKTICTPDGPYLRDHSSRTGVQVKDSRLNDNNISFQADRESDCLSDRSCHPTPKGTETLSVDKPETKTAKSKRSVK
jgi:hypothetical protein